MSWETDFIGFTYALVIIAGGIFGYVKSGSIPSLISGIVFGIVMLSGAFQTSQQPKNTKIMMYASGLLCVIMAFRVYKTMKIMPAGVICVMSLLMLGRSVYLMNNKAAI